MSTNYIENKIKELSVRIEELSNQLTSLSAIDEMGRIKVDSKTQKISKEFKEKSLSLTSLLLEKYNTDVMSTDPDVPNCDIYYIIEKQTQHRWLVKSKKDNSTYVIHRNKSGSFNLDKNTHIYCYVL